MRPLPKTKAVKDKAAKRAKADAAENVIGLTKSPESTTLQSTPNPALDMDQRVSTKKPFGRTLAVGLIAALLLGGLLPPMSPSV